MNDKLTLQYEIERTYSVTNAKKVLFDVISEIDEVVEKYNHAIELIREYASKSYWPSKDYRIQLFMESNNLSEVVTDIFVRTIPVRIPEELTAVVGSLAHSIHLGTWEDGMTYEDKAKTVAELLAVICETDLYDIIPAAYSNSGSLELVSNIDIPEEARAYVNSLMYTPPSIIPYKKIRRNKDNGYLLGDKNSGVILKAINRHNYKLGLDAINIANSVCFSLDQHVLHNIEETPSKDFTSEQAKEQFYLHVEQAHKVYELIEDSGNQFYFNHKFDKRGRMYTSGYHINLQANEYKKALINLAKEETIPLD